MELSRGEFFGVTAASGAAGLVAASAPGGTLKVRWYGGGVYELATPDDKAIVLVDAWIWNNTGWKAFGIDKPAELASAPAYVAHVKARNPDAFVIALTHDHGDHMGDYFELLRALTAGGVELRTVGQSDLFRVNLVQKFKEQQLDYPALVLNNGAGINMGGTASWKGVRLELVPAIHSTAAGYPAAGFIIDIGGVRVYASGDTDLFGDMALIGARYRPQLAMLSTGNGAFTMGPEDAASACKLIAPAHAIPVHYAHNPLVLQTECGQRFRDAVARLAPATAVTVMRPGETATVRIG
ncbi:MAG TPA: MBL fold metallo-hydrolase [Candidatus Baltobacteraceae bacterium]|nr:MBL fold metallo-hydrolase [Candidatus Baltobacteraceae bacterium]